MARRFSRGFTLVEMLVVIVIIGVLVGLLLPALSTAKEHARKRTARLEAGQLEMALRAWYTDYRGWAGPGGTPGSPSNLALVTLLQGTGGRVPYMEFGSRRLVSGAMVDPWGAPYRLAYCNANNEVTVPNYDNNPLYRVCAVWSIGPDGRDEGGKEGSDDVCSWK